MGLNVLCLLHQRFAKISEIKLGLASFGFTSSSQEPLFQSNFKDLFSRKLYSYT